MWRYRPIGSSQRTQNACSLGSTPSTATNFNPGVDRSLVPGHIWDVEREPRRFKSCHLDHFEF